MKRILPLVAVVAAAGAGVAWYRVADTYNVSAQLSPAIAGGFGALAAIGGTAVLAATFAARDEARKQRSAHVDTIALAIEAVESMLRRSQQ